ncbi:TIGR03905 family TSCPD domain-containing protein [Parabacteroides sp. OttesenSCG-928-K15]|nr:TIGR03905 family TSCPD domain-containing protein [Parabacteroides sp. OttesenSCG-928-K15]
MDDKQQIIYTPQGGVCSRQLTIDVEDNTITGLEVAGGCQGNSLGVAALIKGMPVDEAIVRLEGIHCGRKDTSCPDQIARALKEWRDANRS